MVRMQRRGRLGFVIVEHAEAAGEGNLLLRRQVLFWKDENDMLEPGLVDLLMLRVGQRLAKVDATDFRARREAQRGDFE